MRVPLSWLRDYVSLPDDLDVAELAERLTFLGLKLEALESAGDVDGPLVVGRVLACADEPQTNGKTIRWCQVDVGEQQPRGVVCGAHNFAVGDLVVVALPGTTLPGGFRIEARKTYGHVSDGMICSARELGLGDDHTGIMVLQAGEAGPGDDAVSVLGLRDDVIELEINPDRAYALSMRGVARDAAVAYDLPFTDPASTLPSVTAGDGYPVRLDDQSGCDRFVALEVSGFDPSAPTPRWLARRLRLAGQRPISLAVDVTNYVMLELGNPIHGYDADRLQGEIVVRRARPGEVLTTLDDATRRLDPEDLLITDDSGPIGLAGVMGGAETELSASTTRVIIEAAHFDPVSIARTAKRHKLPSEASRRFERGVDATVAVTAARRVADLLVEHGGGVMAATGTVAGPEPSPFAPITIPVDLPARVAGFDIAAAEAVRTLELVGCEVTTDGETLTATPPTWRHDITDPNDLVEEVVRVLGYGQVPSIVPRLRGGRGLTAAQRRRRLVADTLASHGYVETLSYPFVAERDWDGLGLDADDSRRVALRVRNPLSDELPLLRTTLLPGLLRVLGRTSREATSRSPCRRSAPSTGRAATSRGCRRRWVDRAPTADERTAVEVTLPEQPLRLAVAASGDRTSASWWGDAEPVTWADAIEAVRLLARTMHVALDVEADTHAPWHPGRCARLSVAGRLLGHAGELHPAVCKAFGVPARTVAAEIDLGLLIGAAVEGVRAPTLSSYPVGKEDVALVVAVAVAAADVEAALVEGAGPLLESARLFDVYDGEQVADGHKSLAFALRFRAPDRTLTEAEIQQARDAAVSLAAARVGAVQRV